MQLKTSYCNHPFVFPGTGFPLVPPVRKSPMVEQAVQTGPVDNMNQKKPPPAKVVSGIQRNGRQIPQSSKTNGNRRTRPRSRGQNRPATVKENTIKFEGDFDFESANAQFNREELDKEFKKKLNFKDSKGTEKAGLTALLFSSRRTTWAEERKLNTETFGVSGRFLRGRSFRGGFRGGRGSGAARRNQTTHRAGTGRV
uniref:Uncharacterized protein n=1 Tax=Gopherus agassizii TaxID=38772 RepID=A0A452GSR8_9SAUR